MSETQENRCDKLILAVLQGDEYLDTIEELNEHGFYATVLHSSGGFLKKQSVTIMIGLERARLDEAIALLKAHGQRTEIRYHPAVTGSAIPPLAAALPMATPVPVRCGGVTLFVLDVEQFGKY